MAPLLTLPEDDRTIVFREFCYMLQDDPDLFEVLTWVTWEGEPGESEAPTPEVCPWVRLTPMADESGRRTSERFSAPMLITIETAVEGSDVADSINLWGAIETAIFTWVQEALADFGVAWIEVLKPTYGIPEPNKASEEIIYPEPGQVRLVMDVEI